jgi:hypothetical protein
VKGFTAIRTAEITTATKAMAWDDRRSKDSVDEVVMALLTPIYVDS